MEDNFNELDIFDDRSDYLEHYGMPRRSGRYPWGSGENPYQHSKDFLARYEELQKQGLSNAKIAEAMKISTTDMTIYLRNAKHERWMDQYETMRSMREHGASNREIAEKIFGDSKKESTVRSMLDKGVAENKSQAVAVADKLRERIEQEGSKGMIDVGAAVENELGCSKQTLDEALFILQNEGYPVYGYGQKQVTNIGKQSNTRVLGGKDVVSSDPYQRPLDVKSYTDYEADPEETSVKKTLYPASLDSRRVYIRYPSEGGKEKDGTIEIRPGVRDLDLGNDHYAQVRILVDDNKFMKGMAWYSDDIPKGYDVVYNTSKTDPSEVFKDIKKGDPNNPFGALISANGQSFYTDGNGQEQLSKINKLKSEGDWAEMSRNLSPQFLAKQPIKTIKRQLDLTFDDYMDEYKEIDSITNPTIRKKMLLDLADDLEGAEVTLKAVAFPGQMTEVIFPLESIRDTQVYAPNFQNGSKLALVRYPHTGRFELPILTVNNNNAEGRKKLGHARDAIGISPSTAETLSGADFDGDFVIAIPIGPNADIKNEKRLKGLVGFEPKDVYSTSALRKEFESRYSPEEIDNMDKDTYRKLFQKATGVKLMTSSETQKQMGIVSNLISDMTLQGAPAEDLERAVRHSMVVIDAEKHKLDYKKSEKDNDIIGLKKVYQPKPDGGYGGASSLFTRKGQDVRIPERQGSGWIDKETGEKHYRTTGRKYYDRKTGELVEATTKISAMNAASDPNELSSGTAQEQVYVNYINKIRSLRDAVRKDYANSKGLTYDKSAAVQYSAEVTNLKTKLSKAERNRPKERRANAIAQDYINSVRAQNPDMTKKELKKLSQVALTNARAAVGASGKDVKIRVTDSEWDAIQKGAISDALLTRILRYADTDDLYERALPHTKSELSDAKIAKIERMLRNGYTQRDIANALNISVTTVNKYSSEMK